MEGFELAIGLEVGLDNDEPADVGGDECGWELRKALILRKRRREWDAGMRDAVVAGGAVLEAPARGVDAELGEVEIDGVDGAAGEDAVIADSATAAAVREDGQAVGAARVVGVDGSRGGIRAKAAVAGGATNDGHAGEGSGAVTAGRTVPGAITHSRVGGV